MPRSMAVKPVVVETTKTSKPRKPEKASTRKKRKINTTRETYL